MSFNLQWTNLWSFPYIFCHQFNTKDLVALTKDQQLSWRLIKEDWDNKNYKTHYRLAWFYFLMKLFNENCSTAQLHSTKAELRFWAGLNAVCGMSEICNGEDLWQWSQLKIRLNAFHWSTIPQKQFITLSYK